MFCQSESWSSVKSLNNNGESFINSCHFCLSLTNWCVSVCKTKLLQVDWSIILSPKKSAMRTDKLLHGNSISEWFYFTAGVKSANWFIYMENIDLPNAPALWLQLNISSAAGEPDYRGAEIACKGVEKAEK